MRLLPVYIAKPWGREIWFTGMEARGESQVATQAGNLDLSTYLALDPKALTGGTPLLLLKILDPKPDAVTGDLYFEVHEEKQEVYVVTHVDAGAWPDGRGGIRFGMCQEKRAGFANDAAFRAAYLEAVQAYEAVRRRIDDGASDLVDEEIQRRADMEAFTAMRRLTLGDVVRVPTWTPHSLQHGVRVVEFQTPTYERFIISFAQKVLTQDHWDTAHAVANMHLDAPAAETFEQVAPGVERVASFSDFNVWRAQLDRTELELPGHLPYAVCMCIDGEIALGKLRLGPEEAGFIPRAAVSLTPISGHGRLLIAAPDL